MYRELGYLDALNYRKERPALAGSGLIWLNEVACSGTEQNLANCSHADWGTGASLCTHDEDVVVHCISGKRANKYNRMKVIIEKCGP